MVPPSRHPRNRKTQNLLTKTSSVSISVPSSSSFWHQYFCHNLIPFISSFLPAQNPQPDAQLQNSQLIASDNDGAADNLNSLLSHTATEAGTYTVEIQRVGSTFGEYLLEVNGSTANTTGFAVTGTTPASGEAAKSPTVYQVHLNREVMATTLDASDLTIDGQSATGVRLVNGHTVEFTLPAGLTEKDYTAAIAAGAFTDINGRGIPAFTSTLRPDFVSPHIVSSTLGNGDSVALGNLTVEMQFNEALLASVLDAGDVQLVGARTGSVAPNNFGYNDGTSTLTMEFPDLADDSYTLTLLSGENAFRDLVGHGLEGGDLTIHFSAQAGNVTLNNFQPIGALGPQAYLTSVDGRVSDATADTFTVQLNAGETLSLLLEPDSALKGTIDVTGPGGGAAIASATAPSAGQAATLQNVLATQTGTYTVALSGAGGSTGDYRLEALKNAVHEDFSLDEEAVENVDDSFRSLGGSDGEQLVVYGSLHALGESFESGEPSENWHWGGTGEEVVPVFASTEWGCVDGDTALMMHGTRHGAYWTVDVSQIENPVVSFWHASWEGGGQELNWYEVTNWAEADGVGIQGIFGEKKSQGGGTIEVATPIRLWVPPDQKAGEWVHYTIDLAAVAEANGDELAPLYRIGFQQVDWYDTPGYGFVCNRLLPEVGRGWDAILVTSSDPIDDWYEFTLEDGQSASLAMAAEGLPAEAVLEVYDDADNLLAIGRVEDDGTIVINDFLDLTADGSPDTYRVRAGAVVTTPDWNYSLSVIRNDGTGVGTAPFKVDDIAIGSEPVGTIPTLDLSFGNAVAIGSVQAGGFQVNGMPAESVRMIDSHTVRIQPTMLSSGTWNVEVAAGTVQDLRGMDVQAFSGSVNVPINDTLLEGLLQETVFLGELGSSDPTDEWLVQLGVGQDVTILLEGEGALAPDVRLLAADGSQVASGAASAGGQAALQHSTTVAGRTASL